MLSNKQERTFSNAPLRDQWEKRAQNIAAQCKQEAEWKEKSVKLLFSKWTYHLVISHGDKLSDLKKLTNSTNEEETKPKIKFKIVPPPPRIKHEAALPPPSPRKKASSGLRRPKRKVDVDMFKLYWRESWMSLKPPKYLYLKTKEMKTRIPGFTTIELTNNRRYKRTWSGSLAELMCLHEKWTHSWKQVKSPAQLERSEEKQFQWEILFESNLPCKPEIEEYFLPVWARTWKFMNFAFRQQKQNWDCIWLDYQQILSNKFDKVQQLQEQEEPSDWEDSWQLPESQKTTNTTVMLTLNNVFQPSWTNSWLLTVAPLQEDEEYQKNWSSCWGFRQQIRWCKASQQSQYEHSNMLMRRRKIMNLLLTSQLENKITNSTEWSEAWRMPTPSGRLEKDELEDEEEMDIEETMDTEEEEEDEGVDHEEDVNVDDEEERDEGVDEEEEDMGKEDEEDIGKNEQYEQIHECPKEIYKKEDKEIYKKNEQVEDNNGEEEDEEVNKENKKEVEEEDKISNEKNKESEVDEEKEEEDADKEGEDSDSDEEEEIDEETDKERKEEPKVDKPVKNEVNEKDEDNDNVEEEGTEIEEDGGEEEKEDEVEKEQDREEETEVEEEDEEVNEKAKVHKKDDKTKEEEEEETDEKEETDEEDEVTASSEENGSHEEMDKKEEDNVVEKEKEKKKLRKGVKRKPDVPLHLQFHKLNMSFSSWNQSWMVVVAHRGGDGNEEEEDEEKEEWWPWKESWRICRWRKLDEDEVVCFSMEHRTQRHLGLTHEEDGMPRSKWTLSWKMTNAAAEEEDTEEEDEEEEEEEET